MKHSCRNSRIPPRPDYRTWLTPQQFAAKFGVSDTDLARVKDWLTAQGFIINEVAQGTVGSPSAGRRDKYPLPCRPNYISTRFNGEVHFANGTEPAVPERSLWSRCGFRSLHDFRPHRRSGIHRVKPDFPSNISGNHYVAPDDLARIYNLSGLFSAGIDGTGQKLAVMGQTDIKLPDIATFRSVAGLPANVPQVILVPGSSDPGVVTNDLFEADLDIEWSGAVARNAQIIYVNSNNGAFDSLQYAVDQNLAPVLSISYGDCEPHFMASDFAFIVSLGQQANAQGQTIVAPSGDDGAADCDFSTTSTPVTVAPTHGLAVEFQRPLHTSLLLVGPLSTKALELFGQPRTTAAMVRRCSIFPRRPGTTQRSRSPTEAALRRPAAERVRSSPSPVGKLAWASPTTANVTSQIFPSTLR